MSTTPATDPVALLLGLVLLGYLFGSISTAVLVARVLGLPDPRKEGSGNPGATNVLRLGGKRAALITLVGDLLKGLLPVLAARAMDLSPTAVALTAVAAFAGHLYPAFFGFKGGKGVATAAGVLLAMAPIVALVAITTWILGALLTRLSSLSALLAAIAAPLTAWLLGLPDATQLATGVIALLLVWRHRANVRRLIAGTEPRIGQKASSDRAPG
ncbi:MAG: glycerol-3-phosphate 1-O-acyltransferase PlsY [Halothiobacillaceae bacterium]